VKNIEPSQEPKTPNSTSTLKQIHYHNLALHISLTLNPSNPEIFVHGLDKDINTKTLSNIFKQYDESGYGIIE
jgi:hypothetical protein